MFGISLCTLDILGIVTSAGNTEVAPLLTTVTFTRGSSHLAYKKRSRLDIVALSLSLVPSLNVSVVYQPVNT